MLLYVYKWIFLYFYIKISIFIRHVDTLKISNSKEFKNIVLFHYWLAPTQK